MTVTRYGNATWYSSCGSGGGACGCYDSKLHTAYPRLTTTGCYYDCDSLCNRACGGTITVTNLCSGGLTKTITVKDCYPASLSGCSYTPACISSHKTPLLDLTRGAFMALGADLSQGRIPVKVVC